MQEIFNELSLLVEQLDKDYQELKKKIRINKD